MVERIGMGYQADEGVERIGMDMSSEGVTKLIAREGCKLKAYKDLGGVWTICVGHTSMAGPPRVKPGMTATMDQCKTMLKHDLNGYEDCVENCISVPMSQHEFDALVSLCYNIGCTAFKRSSVVRHLNKGDRNSAAHAFLLWNKVKGRAVRGLTNRRQSEREQFLGWDTKEV
jgi:lysozyme